MTEMHFRRVGFTYSTCGTFTKNKERIQIFTGIDYLKYIYEKELDKAFFRHDMDQPHRDFKDFSRRIV